MVGTQKPRWSVLFPRPFASVEGEMDQLMERFLGRNGEGGPATGFAPANLWEEQGKWCVEVELPGVTQEDVDVTLEKNVLCIAADRKLPEGERKYWHQERSYGRFERSFKLPETVDPEGIQAELRDGILSLSLAKKPESQPRKIGVKHIRPE